ncbi:MAG: heme ABC transporter ATP-binding protein [Pseudomonadota bacterium]
MLEARDVTLRLGGATLLRRASLTARAGELLALCGPNGAGKSSLLSLLSGERRPSSGAVLIGGAALSDLTPRGLARVRAALEQHPAVDVGFSVAALVALGGSAAPPDVDFDIDAAVALAMARTGVQPLAQRAVRTLSGGERHRAHLARVLVQLAAGRAEGGGRVLLLDEPTASLDLAHQAAVLRTVRAVAEEGVAVIAVLHDLTLAAAFADRVALMNRGGIDAIGPPAAVFTAPRLSTLYDIDVAVAVGPAGRPMIHPNFSAPDGAAKGA